MTMTIQAVFDGEVFRPKDPVSLPLNVTYTITVEADSGVAANDDDEHPLTRIGRLETDMGVTDLASNHDWYAHRRIPDPKHGE